MRLGWAALLTGATLVLAVPPDWAVTSQWPACPPATCWVGVGSGPTADKARQASMADISRQVRARIRSSTSDSRWEEGGRSGESATDRNNVKSDEQIAGIQIVQTAQDGSTWYALATLERSDLAAPGRAAMEAASNDAVDRVKRLRAALNSNRPQDAADQLSALDVDRRGFQDGRDEAALGEPQARAEEFPLSAPVRDSFFRVLRTGLKVEGPDTVVVSRNHSEPVAVAANATWNGAPVADLGLELDGPDGTKLASGRTDSSGKVLLHPGSGSGETWTLRTQPGPLFSASKKIAVRWTGSVPSYRLDLAAGSEPWRQDLSKALARRGWSLDDGSDRVLSATLKTAAKGELDGMDGALLRYEVKASLEADGHQSSCTATAAGSTSDAAIRAALNRLNCPAP
jgi:hypothetical protein